jgi:hypothetical protein
MAVHNACGCRQSRSPVILFNLQMPHVPGMMTKSPKSWNTAPSGGAVAVPSSTLTITPFLRFVQREINYAMRFFLHPMRRCATGKGVKVLKVNGGGNKGVPNNNTLAADDCVLLVIRVAVHVVYV